MCDGKEWNADNKVDRYKIQILVVKPKSDANVIAYNF